MDNFQAQLGSAWLSLAQLDSAWLSLAQLGSAWLSLAQLVSACLSLAQLGSTWLLFYLIFEWSFQPQLGKFQSKAFWTCQYQDTHFSNKQANWIIISLFIHGVINLISFLSRAFEIFKSYEMLYFYHGDCGTMQWTKTFI